SSCTSAMTTLPPLATSMRTVPAPRPDAPPVTMNTLSLISIATLFLLDGMRVSRLLASAREGLHDAVADFLDRAEPFDLAICRSRRIIGCGPGLIVVDQRACLLAIHRQAVAYRFLAVVVALHQRLAGHVVGIGDFRRIELDVVRATAGRVDAPPAHAFDDAFFGYDQFDHEVQGNAGGFQRISLWNGAGEAVEQVALLAVGLLQAVSDQADDQIIGNKAPGIHDLFRLDAKGGLGLHGRAQHIAGGNLWNAKFFGDEGCLGTFARSGWT